MHITQLKVKLYSHLLLAIWIIIISCYVLLENLVKIEKLLVKFRVLYFNISHRQFEDRFVILSLLRSYNILQAGKGSSCQVKLKQFFLYFFYLFIIFDLSHDFLPNHDSSAKAHPAQKIFRKKRKKKMISLGLVKLNFSISRFSKLLSLACDDNRLMMIFA